MAKKCKYAGELDDKECCKCNGYTMLNEHGEESYCENVCAGFAWDKLTEQNILLTPPIKKPKYAPTAETMIIGAKSGISKEINGVWYKFEAWEERTLPVEQTSDFDIEQEKMALWDAVNKQVDDQVTEVLKVCGG